MLRPGRLLGGGGDSSKSTSRKPDSPFIVFYGRSETVPAELTGTLQLTITEPIDIRRVNVQLEGTQKVSWNTKAVNPQYMAAKKTFLDDSFCAFPPDEMTRCTHRINPGTHKWPFKFTLQQTLPESVEGLPGSYIVYNLNASIDRGWGSRALTTSKRIRIIRTLGIDSLNSVNFEQINEDIWTNKISYRITVPKVHYIFGTNIAADFVLTPIKKGVTIGKIRMEMVEIVAVRYQSGDRTLKHRQEYLVCKTEANMPEDSEVLVTDLHPESLCDESFHFRMNLPLERSLRRCRQSVDSDQINIDHRLKIYVSLHNPEGHTSQLLVKNLVELYISPHFPVGDDACVTPSVARAAVMSEDASAVVAPPTYDQHQLDLLYSDMDQSGLVTPALHASHPASGVNTPRYSLSISGSSENLSSLNAIANINDASVPSANVVGTGASASVLHSRLANLKDASSSTIPFRSPNESAPDTDPSSHQSSSTPRRNQSGYFPQPMAHNPPETFQQSVPIGGDGSIDGLSPNANGSNPLHALSSGSGYDMEALARTPSYNTAVRTSINQSPSIIGLPSYQDATSRNPSPERSPSMAAASPQQPLSVHSGEEPELRSDSSATAQTGSNNEGA